MASSTIGFFPSHRGIPRFSSPRSERPGPDEIREPPSRAGVPDRVVPDRLILATHAEEAPLEFHIAAPAGYRFAGPGPTKITVEMNRVSRKKAHGNPRLVEVRGTWHTDCLMKGYLLIA